MAELGPFPAHFISYSKRGSAEDAGHADGLKAFVTAEALDDLIVISHGWRNNADEARILYDQICTQIGALRAGQTPAAAALAGRKVGVMGVLWPSKPFREFGEERAYLGGAASGQTAEEIVQAQADQALEDLQEALTGDVPEAALQRLTETARAASANRDAFPAFFDALRSALPGDDAAQEGADKAAFGAARDALDVRAQMEAFAQADSGLSADDLQTGGAAGGPTRAARASVGLLLNLSTFYTMKRRAGYVGQRGVAESLAGLRAARPAVRIHFVGHSFGARVLTMAAQTIAGEASARPNSMCLLQAAFSHNSFSRRFPPRYGAGFFRPVVENRMVDGPVVITHTFNDRAVTWAYSLASLVSGQNASALSEGQPSQYGGLGANGAQHTDEARREHLLPADGSETYSLVSGTLHNLLSDEYVKGHADIAGPEVAFAVLSAITTQSAN